MKLLHLADVHLGASYSGFGELAAERSARVLDAFRALPDVAAEERVDAVLFAGDLFDGPQPGPTVMAAVRDTLRRLVDEILVPVFMVPGNHDAITLRLDPYRELARGPRVLVQEGEARPERSWPLKDDEGRRLADKHSVYILAAPRFGDPVSVETDAGPLHVYGFAYDAAEHGSPLDSFRRTPAEGVHVALLHASVQDADHWSSSPDSLVVTTEALTDLDVDYIALGDHHAPRLPDEFSDLPACYPGSFAAMDLSETGPRGWVLASIEPGASPEVEHRESGVRGVAQVELDVSSLGSDVGVVESIAAQVPAPAVPVVHLVGEPSFPLDADRVAVELIERFGHASVLDETRFYGSGRLDELAEEDTVAGHVVRLGRRRVEEAQDEESLLVAQHALRVALRALGVD